VLRKVEKHCSNLFLTNPKHDMYRLLSEAALRETRAIFCTCFVYSGLYLIKQFRKPKAIAWKASRISPKQWFPKCGAPPRGGGAQEILKAGARGAKLFYSLKINKKHRCNLKNLSITTWSFK
jgi:hypothetical protein